MKPKKALGQNFLKDENILRKEVEIAEVAGKIVLEIGSGDGRLTEKILEANPKRIIAVEKDSSLVPVLRKKFFMCVNFGKIDLTEGDFLELQPAKVDVIIGNIPYYISSDIIFRLKDYEFEQAVLIVQKEFAEKMVAKPNDSNYGRLSVTSQLAFDVKLVLKVPRHLFYPAPKVDSAMILLKPTATRLTKKQEDVIRALFQHKNQTVRNALKHSGIKAPEKFAQRRTRTITKEECLEIAKLV